MKVDALKEKIQMETKQYKKVLENCIDQSLLYGEEFMLLHVDSSHFLTGKISSSQSNSSGYKFELSKNLCLGMVFRIFPNFKHRKEGEKIFLDDLIFIKNKKLDCFVSFSLERPIALDLPPFQDSFKNPYKTTEIRPTDKLTQRYEAYLTPYYNYAFTIWHIVLYSKSCKKGEEDFIKGLFFFNL